MAQEKIMIIDDEEDIVSLVRLHLARQGYDVVWTTDSTQALRLFEREQPQLILLDVMMQGLDGYELCSRIREQSTVPLIFMSCKGRDMDKVMGLSIGGDDYITKPFSMTELAARVQAHLRRTRFDSDNGMFSPLPAPSASDITCGEIRVDTASHAAFLGDTELSLTGKEFDLLCLLARQPNRVFTPRQIFDALWDPYGLENDVRTVAVHISNLRKKLETGGASHKYICTVRGVGYKISVPAATSCK